MRQAQKDRAMNYLEVRHRLDGEDGVPAIFFMDDLHHFWRTVPNLQLDETNPEKGPDSTQEDHIYDTVAYMCRSRPYRITAEQRMEQQFKRQMKAAQKAGLSFRGLRRR